METFFQKVQERRKTWLCVCFGFAVFFGCFTFPIFNWNKEWSVAIRGTQLLMPLLAYYEIGLLLGLLFPKKRLGTVLLLNLGHVLVGMGCRYLLEFGEVSNTYNFTWANSLFHIAVLVGYCSLSWFLTAQKVRGIINTNHTK